jgi:hypothetical protein
MNYPDLQTLTLVGRIAALTVITTEDDRECLVVTLYHRITTDTTITVKFLNSNGLLTAYSNDNLVDRPGANRYRETDRHPFFLHEGRCPYTT